MPRIAKRLYGPAALTTSAATKYTVPALTKTIIRHIHVNNPSAAAVDFTFSIGADATGVRYLDGFPVPADAPYDHYCYLVMDAAEILQAFGSSTVLVLTISGDESILG